MNKKYYAVEVKCGHVGKGKFITVKFAIEAESGKEAAYIGRWMPRAKHHNKKCILSVTKVSYDDYLVLKKQNNANPYLHCQNKQEQNIKCLDIYDSVNNLYEEKDDFYYEKRKERIEYKKKKESYKNNLRELLSYDYELNFAY